VFEMRTSTLLNFLEQLDALRRPQRFDQFLRACEADSRGRTGFEDRDYPQATFLKAARDLITSIKPDPTKIANHSGKQIAENLRQQRIAVLEQFKRTH